MTTNESKGLHEGFGAYQAALTAEAKARTTLWQALAWTVFWAPVSTGVIVWLATR